MKSQGNIGQHRMGGNKIVSLTAGGRYIASKSKMGPSPPKNILDAGLVSYNAFSGTINAPSISKSGGRTSAMRTLGPGQGVRGIGMLQNKKRASPLKIKGKVKAPVIKGLKLQIMGMRNDIKLQ